MLAHVDQVKAIVRDNQKLTFRRKSIDSNAINTLMKCKNAIRSVFDVYVGMDDGATDFQRWS
jgi:hypothetical protein